MREFNGGPLTELHSLLLSALIEADRTTLFSALDIYIYIYIYV